jgi:erythromycin esterase-like protein
MVAVPGMRRRDFVASGASAVLGAVAACHAKLVYVPPELVRHAEAVIREVAVPIPAAAEFSSRGPEAMQQCLSGAKWIGMGEASHGSKEFFDWKVARRSSSIAA